MEKKADWHFPSPIRFAPDCYRKDKAMAVPIFVCGLLATGVALYWAFDAMRLGGSHYTLLLTAPGMLMAFFACLMRPMLFGWLFVTAVVFSPRMAVGEIPGRTIELRIEDFVFFAMCLWFLLQFASHSRLAVPLWKPMGFYLGVALISTLMGVAGNRVPMSRAAFYWLRDVEYMGLTLIFANLFEDRDELLMFLKWMLVFAFVVPVWVLCQRYGGSLQVSLPFDIPGRAQVGGFCLVFAAFSLAWWAAAEDPRWRRVLLISFGAHLAGIIASASRTFFAGVIAAMCLILFSAFRRATLSLRGAGVIFLSTVLALVLGYAIPKTFLGRRLEPQVSILLGPDLSAGEFLGARHGLYRRWFGEGGAHLLLGGGKGWSPGGRVGFEYPTVADSQYNLAFGEVGLLGMVAFAAVLVSVFLGARAIRRRGAWEIAQALALAMSVLVVIYALCGITTGPFYATKSAEPFWMLAGLMFAAGSLSDARQAQGSRTRTESSGAPRSGADGRLGQSLNP